ncbi:MAG: TIR domain-containing protein [Candidatus Delongbacteria bacterium]|nr:TIR domain-containing protein [Candidatus Delongbacteria bacterium]
MSINLNKSCGYTPAVRIYKHFLCGDKRVKHKFKMKNPIERNAHKLIAILFANNPNGEFSFNGDNIQELSGLKPIDINNAIDFLSKKGLIERFDLGENHPYNFSSVLLNGEGNYQYHELNKIDEPKDNPKNPKPMKIFISHSHNDVEIAKSLIELLRVSLNLKSEDIRCTSIDGYRLPAGISTDEQLKTEIHDSEVLIGLISPSSISSYYVLFELGARWGANRPLIPLITNELGSDLLKGPLQGINALNTTSEAQLFQLISDLEKLLDIHAEPANAYQSYVSKLSKLSSSESSDNSDQNKGISFGADNSYDDSDEIIKNYCKNYWTDDFSMQVSCINEQKEAVNILKKGKPDDITDDDFTIIRKKAAEDWPDDFTMRVSQEHEQFDAIRKLKK